MQYLDWGVRSPRWRGISSETTNVCGRSVHYLRAEADLDVAAGAPTHVLVHPMAAGGTFWLDLIRPLTAHGPVVAPDLPGSLFGHTDTPCPGAARIEANARFLRAFTSAPHVDRVIVHGWSMGGLVALRFADLAPDRVERLVLADVPLPGPLAAPQRLGWQTIGRLALLVGPALARGLVRLWGRRAIERKLAYLEQTAFGRLDTLGGDLSRIAPENLALWTDQLAELRTRPDQLGYAATAFASVASAIFVNRRPGLEAIGRVDAPVLVLWGDEDPLIERPVIDHIMGQRPDWDLHVFPSAGHAAPLEVPDEYVREVDHWLGRAHTTGDSSVDHPAT